MSDIVTILREWAHVEGICDGDPDTCVGAACDKAADEIERLRRLWNDALAAKETLGNE